MEGNVGLKVSLITTVKNEASSIGDLLSTIVAQTRLPDEVIIVDGGSSDGTVERVNRFSAEHELPIKLLVRPEANISEGRNAAIGRAVFPIIASTDAGVRLTATWLEELLRPFLDRPDSEVVSGFFLPDPQYESAFGLAMGATVLPVEDDIDPKDFLPSSRSVAFTKNIWYEAGGYPEWLDYCEDLVFDFKLRELTGTFAFAPKALVYFKPRTSLRDFFLQYYRYARGDGKANLWPKRHAIRYTTYLVAPIVLVGGAWFPLAWIALAVAMLSYTSRPYQRLLPKIEKHNLLEAIQAILWVPIIRFVGDVAKMAGYPVGVYWRLKNRSMPT